MKKQEASVVMKTLLSTNAISDTLSYARVLLQYSNLTAHPDKDFHQLFFASEAVAKSSGFESFRMCNTKTHEEMKVAYEKAIEFFLEDERLSAMFNMCDDDTIGWDIYNLLNKRREYLGDLIQLGKAKLKIEGALA